MHKESTKILNENSCFDLQFRRDVKRNRASAPVYYRWKAEFVVTAPKGGADALGGIQKTLACGKMYRAGSQARFSVQNLEELHANVVPFFQANPLAGNKQKDFDLWRRAIAIIYRNKGKHILAWKKQDLLALITTQQAAERYKTKPRGQKWLDMARTIARNLPAKKEA